LGGCPLAQRRDNPKRHQHEVNTCWLTALARSLTHHTHREYRKVAAGLSQHSSIFRLFPPQVQHVLIKELHKRDLRETLRFISAELKLNERPHGDIRLRAHRAA
jgi:hypothetical protein